MQDFLLELGFEELPARFISGAMKQLTEAITAALAKERLSHGEILQFSTPRRVAVIIKNLQMQQEDLVEEVKGPPVNIARDEQGNLTKAGQGFLRSQKVDESALLVKSVQGADYLFVRKEVKGQETYTLLKPLLEEIISGLTFPKNMRWGDYELRYARPLRWIVALLGSRVIPVEVGPVQAGRESLGHRQLSSGPVAIAEPKDYCSILKENYVLADALERRTRTWEQIQALAKEEGAVVQEDERLLQEVVNLVEYPTAFCGGFPSEYLKVPADVLITSMKEHQRYFPLYDGEGRLLPKFIGVRNGADNHLTNVIQGNEKVLQARLADAKFFYEEDLKVDLSANLPKLDQVVFQDKLGSMGDKVRRLEKLTSQLASLLGEAQYEDTARRVALLAKCDLVSGMVYEFPELQGVMGEQYALAQGESPVVAAGIREHYLPRFSGDVLPQTIEGTLVSLADRLDTLVGYFALGRIPTGSQDPFALRRQAQGVVQILLQRGYPVNLEDLIAAAERGYDQVSLGDEYAAALVDFFLARLKVILQEQGYSYDVIDGAMASGDHRIPNLVQRVEALTRFQAEDGFQDLMTGFERVANLAAKADGAELVPSAFAAADQEFFNALEELEQVCRPLADQADFQGILRELAAFRTKVDSFFEQVMIMDQDPTVRSNRLALLQKAVELYTLWGDLRLIVGNK